MKSVISFLAVVLLSVFMLTLNEEKVDIEKVHAETYEPNQFQLLQDDREIIPDDNTSNEFL